MRDSTDLTVEFVESVQPPIPKYVKWVLIISTSFGCPVECQMCDAGRAYRGNLTPDEMIAQIDYLITRYFPDRKVPIPKLKIQFARMGEPAFNRHVLDVLERLPQCYGAPGLMPAISTVAPRGCEGFFERLRSIKRQYYSRGKFQLQFSVHTTDPSKRDLLMPVRKWSLAEISQYGERFFEEGDRKVSLNFAAAEGFEIDASVISTHFDPAKFAIKITPVNPTMKAQENELVSALDPYDPKSVKPLVDDLTSAGFDVIVSIGELEENRIGSNCGYYLGVKDLAPHQWGRS